MRRRTYSSGGWCKLHDTKAGDKITHIRYPVNPASYPDKRYGDSASDCNEYPPQPAISVPYNGLYARIRIRLLDGTHWIDILQRAKGLGSFNVGLYNSDSSRLDSQPFINMVPYATLTSTNGRISSIAQTHETMQALSVLDENNNWNGAFQIKDGYFIIDLEKYAIAMVRRLSFKWTGTFDSQTNTFTYGGEVYGVAFSTPAEIYDDCSNLGYGSGRYNNYDLWDIVEVYRV